MICCTADLDWIKGRAAKWAWETGMTSLYCQVCLPPTPIWIQVGIGSEYTWRSIGYVGLNLIVIMILSYIIFNPWMYSVQLMLKKPNTLISSCPHFFLNYRNKNWSNQLIVLSSCLPQICPCTLIQVDSYADNSGSIATTPYCLTKSVW